MGVRADETMTEPGMANPPRRVSDKLPDGSFAPRGGSGREQRRSARSATRSSTARPADDLARAAAARRRTGARSCGPTSRRCSPGWPSEEKDPRKSLHLDEVPLPELAPDEARGRGDGVVDQLQHRVDVDLRAGPDVRVPQRLGRESVWGARHDQPFHVVGSDAAGVVLRVGSAVRSWKPGDAVTVHCNHVDDQDPSAHDDSMLATNQRIWGYETNYGGLGELTLVKANQLMPKPAHLTWEEAAVNALTNSTSYRMLVSPNGARMTQGQTVLIWGASGGIGAYACQYVLNGGGTPVAVVSSPERADAGAVDGRRARHRPRGRGLPVLEGRADPGPGRVAPVRQAHPRARRAPIPTSCSSTPGDRRWARRCSCARAAAPSSPARPRPAS